MQIIFDTQFYSIYALKIISSLFMWLSMLMAQRLFSEVYMKRVYANQTSPPNLQKMLIMMFFIHGGFNLFILVILALLYFTLYQKNSLFVVNSYLIQSYIMDYLFSIAVTWFITFIVASIMQSKKYFRYETEGLRAIRALSDITFYISIIVNLFPFSYLIM